MHTQMRIFQTLSIFDSEGEIITLLLLLEYIEMKICLFFGFLRLYM